MKKILALLVLSLFIIPTASALSYPQLYFNSLFGSTIVGSNYLERQSIRDYYELQDGENDTVILKGTSDLDAEANYITLSFVPIGGSDNIDTTIDYECLGLSGTYEFPNAIPLALQAYSPETTTEHPVTDAERENLKWLQECTFTADGSNVIMFAQSSYHIENGLFTFFSLPYEGLEEAIGGFTEVIFTGYDLARLGLTILAILLLIFLLVFIWKLIEFFSNRVKEKFKVEELR